MAAGNKVWRVALRLCAMAFAASLLTAVPAFAGPISSVPTTAPDSPSVIVVPQDTSTLSFQKRVAAKQAELTQFQAQLDQLDTELEIAQEQYNGSVLQLGELQQKVDSAQKDLANARQAYDVGSEILASRASTMYKDGQLSTIDVILDSKNFNDFVARIKFINTIGLQDAGMVASLRGQRDLMASQVASLQDSQQQAQALQFELKARRIEVQLRIQERQQMLASAQTDLLRLLNKQAAARNVQEAALLQQVLAGANKAGIVVEPGSPVETALAYHGVPYVWGGATPAGFDCSGLVMFVFAQHGVTLPHYSGSQYLLGQKVSLSEMLPGDCIFFGNPVHHVVIYMGGGYVIQAPHTGDVVKISKLTDLEGMGIAGVRRYPWKLRVGPPAGAVVNPNSVKLP